MRLMLITYASNVILLKHFKILNSSNIYKHNYLDLNL